MTDLPTVDGFRVLEELGAGSVACVYKAVDESLGRVVALKVLRGTIAPSSPFAAQLEREAHVLAELSHPNIGLLHAFSKSESRMHLVLEFVDGFSIATLLRKRPVVAPDCVAAIGAAVARGLAHVHARGVVHRDIKPANVLLSRLGAVKIFDFGIAQRIHATDDAEQPAAVRLDDATAFGTPAYMSPEQILGERVDPRSDVFSLGVVLYQLVCGARPFERGDDVERRGAGHRIRREPPIPLHRRAPDVPVALERIIMRAIEKLPADRFQSAEPMADLLDDLVAARAGVRAEQLVVGALVDAGLVASTEGGGAEGPLLRAEAPVRRAVGGLALLGACAVGAAVFLQASTRREGEAAGARPLELMPQAPGFLRVLATPWAEVWVDGQRVDVTPFARSIPLPPGTHYVTLIHPSAPVEKRVVNVATGDTRTLDVVMAIPELTPNDVPAPRESKADAERK